MIFHFIVVFAAKLLIVISFISIFLWNCFSFGKIYNFISAQKNDVTFSKLFCPVQRAITISGDKFFIHFIMIMTKRTVNHFVKLINSLFFSFCKVALKKRAQFKKLIQKFNKSKIIVY